jgi:very-short-patch-repair endonuclease
MQHQRIIPYRQDLKAKARQQRNNATKAEIKLWQRLKAKKMMGYDFDRQKPLGNFIVDFYCRELRLCIEVDGLTHQWGETASRDKAKDDFLRSQSLHVQRFTDEEVMDHIDRVVKVIENYALNYEQQLPTTPRPKEGRT